MRYLPLFAAIFAITPLAIDMYLPAIPQLALSLNSHIQIVQNTLSIYLIGYAVGMIIFGPLSDRVGRKPLVLFGLSSFAVISGLLGLAETAQEFLTLRFFQALSGGATTVVIPGAIRQLFGKDTAKGLSYVSMIMMVAPMMAPAIGSYLLIVDEWPLIFFALCGYSVVMLILSIIYFPKLETVNNSSSHTNPGKIPQLGFINSYKSVFSKKSAHLYIITSVLAAIVFFTYLTSVSFLYMQVFGFSEQLFSLMFGLNIIALMLSNMVNTRLVPKIGSNKILFYGSIMAMISISSLMLLVINQAAAFYIVASLIITLSFTVIINVNADALVLRQFEHHAGTATAVIGSLRFTSGSLAGPVLTYFFNGTALPFAIMLFTVIFLLLVCQLMIRYKNNNNPQQVLSC